MNEEQPETGSMPSKTFANHIGIFFFKLFEKFIKIVPLQLVCRAGMLAGWGAFYILPSRRRIVARNLRIAIDPALKGNKLDQLVKQNFIRSIMGMVAASKTATMTDEQLLRRTKLMGPDVFDDEDTAKHGLICIVAHSGNWELLSRTYTFFPTARLYGSMYRQMDNPLMEEYLYTKRTNNGAHMFSKEGGIQAPLNFVKRGGGLGILCDQFVQEGFFVPYFGKITGTTYLPALMQKRTGAKMKPCVTASIKPAFWVCHSSEGLSPGEAGGSMFETTIKVNRMLEEQLSKSPLDVFWMHHRWKVTEHFAPADPKNAKYLEQCDLKPFRIIFATPAQLDESVLSVPLVKALKNCRRDMQLTVICPPALVAFWKTVDEVSHVIPQGKANEIQETLNAPSHYNEGPLDIAFLLDDSVETIKGLKPFQPIIFSGLTTHPCSKWKSFKIKTNPNRPGPPVHKIEDYLLIADRHNIPRNNPAFFPRKKKIGQPSAEHTVIAPFSTLGPANEWAESYWSELLEIIGRNQTTLAALPEDGGRAQTLARQLGIDVQIAAPEGILDLFKTTGTVIAVDGLIPALAAHSGTPCVTLFSTRLPARYRPLGSFHQTLHRHRACSPCFRKNCDQKTPCVNDITPAMAAQAFRQIKEQA